MGDLDDWLLEAAGRTSAPGTTKQMHQPSRGRRQGSYSDDDSSSKDDSYDNNKYSKRKPSGSHVPLKKRSKKSDLHQEIKNEEGEHGLDGDSDKSDVGSDLYKDEDDRQQLAQLTELERELILSDRAIKKDDKKLHKQIISRRKDDKKAEHVKKQTSPLYSRSVRMSARSADKSAAKVDALNELRARRMKRDPEGKIKSGEPFKLALEATVYSPISQSESGSESQSEDERMDDSDDEKLALEDIKSITICRSKLAKWFMEPFFEELIVGCFVRVGIGVRSGQNIYRLCIVQNVDSSDPNRSYQLENKTTHKYLNCAWGSDQSSARWQMARVSDSPPSKDEFEQWAWEVERSGGWMPSRKEVKDKKEAIDKANSFVYSAETVKQMLEKKKGSSASRPLNIAAEREKLRREMERAVENEDEPDLQRIKDRIQELEKARQSSEMKNEKALRLQEMNRKNRTENFKTASGLKRVDPNLKAGQAGYDPFSRRWTQSTNYYAAKPEAGAESEADVASVAEGNSIEATETALKEAAGAGMLLDTSAPVDQGTNSNSLHGFELAISLAPLQRFGGAHGVGSAFMARKQRIEARVGCQVEEDDGMRHLLTLSVGDYKRRRGLL